MHHALDQGRIEVARCVTCSPLQKRPIKIQADPIQIPAPQRVDRFSRFSQTSNVPVGTLPRVAIRVPRFCACQLCCTSEVMASDGKLAALKMMMIHVFFSELCEVPLWGSRT